VRLLFDTVILIRCLDNQTARLPKDVRALAENGDYASFASVVSLWEMTIKNQLGKLPLPYSPVDLPEMLPLLGIDILPLMPSHAVHVNSVQPSTNDPFDRMLLSICAVEDMRLVTIDAAIKNHPLAWRA
jgi:PIN domain nuclease of toxin-antitoxin system